MWFMLMHQLRSSVTFMGESLTRVPDDYIL
jgi:hypothetical protein